MTMRAETMAAPDDMPRHGGALAAAAARYVIAAGDWLDLSTGINPAPYPLPALDAADFTRLPDPAALAGLIDAARRAYGVAETAAVVPLPGSDLGLRLLPLLRRAGHVAVLSPTYSGHAEAWRGAGHAVAPVTTLAEAEGADVVVLANPNNPDGRRYASEAILAALGRLPPDGLMLVDEAFADLEPAESLAPRLRDPRLVLLRSFGKFYGLAGLRLGFALGSGAAVERLAALVGDWPLSGPAISVGTRALNDRDWQVATRLRLAGLRAQLDAILERHGLEVAGGTDLFRLVRSADARALHEGLARQGIWTRIFADLPGAIRFGLPLEDGFDRLDQALAAIRTPGRS